ncbi:cation:proton antiporter [Candidatus Micrarchaeota archaeon]|nr:cation:proton antiporter [Candidatus Micrarchaeota archaeon]
MVSVEQLPIIEIGVVLLTALLSGILFTRVGQSAALGYIAAGLVLGPLGFQVLAGEGTSITTLLGEIGVTMLLFYLGLELSIKRFKETGAVATILAAVEMLFAFIAGFFIAKFFGFTDIEAMVIGAMLTATSTVITGKFLIERKLIETPEARVTISVLILEDFFAILVLVFVAALASQQTLNILVINALFFVIAMFFIVSKISKHALNLLSSIGREDQMWLYGMGVFLIVSFFGSTYLGLTPAIGAFFAGFALSESVFGDRIKKELGLFREFFVLFFFVSFGATVTLPQNPEIYYMLVALAIGYVLAKLVAHGITGTAIGMELKSAVTGGILMGALGEFAIIIAIAAQNILPQASDILALAFLLTIVTTSMLPFLYDRRNAIAAAFEKIFPIQLQNDSRILQRQMNAVDHLARDVAFQNTYIRSLGKLFKNLLIAVSIVYLSYLMQEEIAIPLLEFIPAEYSPSLLLLPLIIWPVYKFIAELKFITRKVAGGLIERTFKPPNEDIEHFEGQAADVFTGIILTLVGLAAMLSVYYVFPELYLGLLIPGTYTLLAIMYLSKSFYGLVEKYESMETMVGIERLPAKDQRILILSQEFNDHAKYFQKLNADRMDAKERIQDALRTERLDEAKVHLVRFKRKETKALVNLFDLKAIQKYPMLRERVRESLKRNREFHESVQGVKTRAALTRYLSEHMKPHVFEPSPKASVEEAARHLIERDLQAQHSAITEQASIPHKTLRVKKHGKKKR